MAAKVKFLSAMSVLLVLFLLLKQSCCQNDPTTGAATEPVTTPVLTTTPRQIIPSGTPSPVLTNADISPCPCDLTGLACDVNCCCDGDCSSDDKKTFSQCLPSSINIDDRLCFQENLFFLNNTISMKNVTIDGLFCIYFDNYAERNYYSIPKVITTEKTFSAYLSDYADKTYMPESISATVYADFYKAGDPIYIVYKNLAQGMLRLPAPLASSLCTDKNPTAFLYDQNFQCVRDIDVAACENSVFLDAVNFYTGFKVVTKPFMFNVYLNRSSSENTQDDNIYNNTYTLLPSLAESHFCRDLGGYTARCTFAGNPPSPSYDIAGTCDNAVVQVQYILTYSGTDGLRSLQIQLTLASFKATDLPLIQQYKSTFSKINETSPVQRSGNPGYVVGEPLMAGLRLVNSTRQIILLNENRDRWLTMVRASAEGSCITDTQERASVLFGESMRTGCLLRFSLDNMTDFCQMAQAAVRIALEGGEATAMMWDERYVATFGNSDPQNFGDWVKILFSNRPEISDTISSTQNGPSCRLSLGLHIQVIYTNVGSLTNPQPKILGVSFMYNDMQTITYTCTGAYCQSGNSEMSQAFEVSQSVSFLDVSQEAVGFVGEAPIFLAKVPYDFFYPFLTAASITNSCNIALVLALVIFSMLKNWL